MTNRETWLNKATRMLDKKYFAGNGYTLPENWRVSCGFPKGRPSAIGQCWDKTSSGDETYEIFICPTQDEPTRVLDILLHELIHASVGLEEGHKGLFRKLAQEFGLTGKMTATVAEEGSELHNQLLVFADRLGKYPHSAMKKKERGSGKPSGWTRYYSLTEEDYKVVAHDERVAEFGAPRDPWGDEMEPIK